MSESTSEENWSVESEYQSRMAALTPKERVARSVAMFNMTRESIVKGRVWVEEAIVGTVIPLPPGPDGGIVEGKEFAWKRVTSSGDPAPDDTPVSMGF